MVVSFSYVYVGMIFVRELMFVFCPSDSFFYLTRYELNNMVLCVSVC